ncbi:hypothetical protein NMG60_11003732 [Bertholletia excelsa]
MPESRDRLLRPNDVTAEFSRRRQAFGALEIRLDEPEPSSGNPVRPGGPAGIVATPRSRNGRSRSLNRRPVARGRRGRGRSTNSVLPSWYPRVPLRDITAVVRAFEKKRARLRAAEAPLSSSEANVEHDFSLISPNTADENKPILCSVGKVPKILLDVANQNNGESECLTPQKKLLNSIDTVEKEVMEELKNLKRTSRAKKAERNARISTLMSMR